MIQRIQSIYLLISFILSGVLIVVWKPFQTDSLVQGGLLALSGLLSVVSIFSYQKRQNQFVLGRVNILTNLILLGLLTYDTLQLSGEASAASKKGIEALLPFVSIVFIVLANKAIQKDENLVKSVDRIR